MVRLFTSLIFSVATVKWPGRSVGCKPDVVFEMPSAHASPYNVNIYRRKQWPDAPSLRLTTDQGRYCTGG